MSHNGWSALLAPHPSDTNPPQPHPGGCPQLQPASASTHSGCDGVNALTAASPQIKISPALNPFEEDWRCWEGARSREGTEGWYFPPLSPAVTALKEDGVRQDSRDSRRAPREEALAGSPYESWRSGGVAALTLRQRWRGTPAAAALGPAVRERPSVGRY